MGCFHANVDATLRHQMAMTAVDVRYHCLTCDDFDMCTECHKTRGHEHELAKFNDLLDLTVRVRNPGLLLLCINFPPALLHQESRAFSVFGRAAQDCQVPNALSNIEIDWNFSLTGQRGVVVYALLFYLPHILTISLCITVRV
jgi:hypothetical protein